jgi:hypothetical protein
MINSRLVTIRTPRSAGFVDSGAKLGGTAELGEGEPVARADLTVDDDGQVDVCDQVTF